MIPRKQAGQTITTVAASSTYIKKAGQMSEDRVQCTRTQVEKWAWDVTSVSRWVGPHLQSTFRHILLFAHCFKSQYFMPV